MPTAYPAALDSGLADTIVGTDAMNAAGKLHATQHDNLRDAVMALEAHVGTYPTLQAGDTTSLNYRIGNQTFLTLAVGVGAVVDPADGRKIAVLDVGIMATPGMTLGTTVLVRDDRSYTATPGAGGAMGLQIYNTAHLSAGVTVGLISALELSGQPGLGNTFTTTSKISLYCASHMHWNAWVPAGSAPGRYDQHVGYHAHLGVLGGATDAIGKQIGFQAFLAQNLFTPTANNISDCIGIEVEMGSDGKRRTWGMRLDGGNNYLAGNLVVNGRGYDASGTTPTTAFTPIAGGVGLLVGGASIFGGAVGIFGSLSCGVQEFVCGNARIGGGLFVTRTPVVLNEALVEIRRPNVVDGDAVERTFAGSTTTTGATPQNIVLFAGANVDSVFYMDVSVTARITNGPSVGQGNVWNIRFACRTNGAGAMTAIGTVDVASWFDVGVWVVTIFTAFGGFGLTCNPVAIGAGTTVSWKAMARILTTSPA